MCLCGSYLSAQVDYLSHYRLPVVVILPSGCLVSTVGSVAVILVAVSVT